MGLSANQYQCVASNGVVPGFTCKQLSAGLLTVWTIPSLYDLRPQTNLAATGTSREFWSGRGHLNGRAGTDLSMADGRG